MTTRSNGNDDLTRAGEGQAPRDATPGVDRTPSGRLGRFTPGEIVAGRYRLVTLLGRGGMGEVYRAEDLTLDQPVALKFLPEHVAADAQHLAQFHNELRIARQVSHKNVCRLSRLGEADGQRFLTMEYRRRRRFGDAAPQNRTIPSGSRADHYAAAFSGRCGRARTRRHPS